jgi:hypothetical protein
VRYLPQEDHADLGLVDDDNTEMLAAPVNPGVTSAGRGPLEHPTPQQRKEVQGPV